ncbi:MAG: DUF4421 family protein [Spirochaetes bacterium]|nr:DUF4421 family protein [Spirochaetota bacterium]
MKQLLPSLGLLLILLIWIFPAETLAVPIGGSISIEPETGQETEESQGTREPGEEPLIQDFSDRLILRPYILVPMNFLTISRHYSNDAYSSKDIVYLPNPSLCAGAGVSWWIFGLSFHTAVTPLRDTGDYGRTTFTDIQFNYYFRKFGFDLFYQRYRGFSLEESGSYGIPRGFPGSTRPDMTITTLGGNFFYVFSDNFSYNASFKQTERQTRSGGSVILMLSVVNLNIRSSWSLIPSAYEVLYGMDTGFRGGNFTSIGISPGYAHTFIIGRDYYITPSICLGSGLMKKSYGVTVGERNKLGSFIKANFRLAVGFNSERWFYGIALVVDATSTMSSLGGSGMSASNIGGFIETFGGYRF